MAADKTLIEELHRATQRLVRTVDAMADAQYALASGLPHWSRAHVVAHLALNAEGLTGALTGIVQGKAVAMYPSQVLRDNDIEVLAMATPAELRERLLSSASQLAHALAPLPEDAWATRIERTPGDPRTFTAYAVPGMRLREVEIHHCDLAMAYSPADWPASFTVRLLEAMVKRDAWAEPFTAAPSDLDRTWQCGDVTDGSPTVSGSAADLGWWLTGRGHGYGLTSDSGDLPRIEDW